MGQSSKQSANRIRRYVVVARSSSAVLHADRKQKQQTRQHRAEDRDDIACRRFLLPAACESAQLRPWCGWHRRARRYGRCHRASVCCCECRCRWRAHAATPPLVSDPPATSSSIAATSHRLRITSSCGTNLRSRCRVREEMQHQPVSQSAREQCTRRKLLKLQFFGSNARHNGNKARQH